MGLKDAAKKLMAAAGVPVTPGYLGEDQDPARLQRRGRGDRLAGADQGGGRRRRQGDAQGRCRRRIPGDARFLQARGGGFVRRRQGAARKIYRAAAPYRGAGIRRRPRQCRPSVRARLLAAAPPPEGDRGSAGAGDGRGDPRRGLRRRGQGGQSGRLCRRGHGRVHRRRQRRPERGPDLVHGDEHPPPGRASGDRGDHRRGSGRMAAAGRLGRDAAEAPGRARDPGPCARGAALRRGSGASFPALDRPARTFPAARDGRGSTPASARATGSAPGTTRWSPS